MGSGRAYTKSGSVEKYESSQWSTPLWSSSSAKGTVSTPDSNGNYTVSAPSGYEESTTGGTVTCTTYYGGVAKVFYFTQETPKEINIEFEVILDINYYGSTQGDRITVICNSGPVSIPLPCEVTINVRYEQKNLAAGYRMYRFTTGTGYDLIQENINVYASNGYDKSLEVYLNPTVYRRENIYNFNVTVTYTR